MDLFSRGIVGWSTNHHMKASGMCQAMQMALDQRKPQAGLLHHSDRGVQYACAVYQRLLGEHGMQCGMSRPGNCYDNAPVESFFATLKSELVHRRRFATRAQAESEVSQWIECWYNRRRHHSSLGFLSPESFEAQIN